MRWRAPSRSAARKRWATVGDEGVVFVVEKIGADGESPRIGMDLRVLAYFGGRERALAELTALAADAGLRPAGVHATGHTTVCVGPARERCWRLRPVSWAL
jgi:hypothetical protein